MKKTFLTALTILTVSTCTAGAAQRELNEAWKVEVGQKQKQPIKFFQAESVQLTETFTQNGLPVDLSATNTVVVWEINGWSDYTNTYAICTGVVSSVSNTVVFSLTPAAANLPLGTYLGFVRALQHSGTNLAQVAVLAYQTIAVEWSPDSRNYNLVAPITSPAYYPSSVITNLADRIGALEAQPAVDTNLTAIVKQATNDLAGAKSSITSLQSSISNVWNTITNKADQSDLSAVSNLAASALQVELDPAWRSGTNAIWTAIANATPGGYAGVSNAAMTAFGRGDHRAAGYADQSDLSAVSNLAVSTAAEVSNLESGAEYFEALNLGGTVIDEFGDIGLTYTNAVRLNAAITITNDSQWTGWITTGTLDPVTHVILLSQTNQYLLSPVQSNGIAYFAYTAWSHQNGTTYEAVIWTNGHLASASTPWRFNTGQVYFRPREALPGADFGLYVSNVTITAYTDLTEAQTPKETSNLRVIENPVDASDVANKRYVDDSLSTAESYANTQLAGYAADKTKTLRGAELRLGNMWVVSPADTSGERFIVSGGEISGNGELLGTTNEFIIAKNDYPLMSFKSDASGLYISNFTVNATSTNIVWTLYVATNGVHGTPFAEWSDSLMVGDWSRVLTCQTNTYPVASNGTYQLVFCVPTNRTCFVRAMQNEGSSVAKVLTDVFDVDGAAIIKATTITTTGGVEIVSAVQALGTNSMTKTVYDTNGDDTVDHAQSADTAADASTATYANTAGFADDSGALGGQPPSYYLSTNGNGSALTNLNAGNLTGTLPGGVLGSNIVRTVGGIITTGTVSGTHIGDGRLLTNTPVRCQVGYGALPSANTTVDGLSVTPHPISITSYGNLFFNIQGIPSNSVVRQTTMFLVNNVDTNRALFPLSPSDPSPIYPARLTPVASGTGGTWKVYQYTTTWTNRSALNSSGAYYYSGYGSTSSYPWYVLSTEVLATPIN